jgi:hypothetical protein
VGDLAPGEPRWGPCDPEEPFREVPQLRARRQVGSQQNRGWALGNFHFGAPRCSRGSAVGARVLLVCSRGPYRAPYSCGGVGEVGDLVCVIQWALETLLWLLLVGMCCHAQVVSTRGTYFGKLRINVCNNNSSLEYDTITHNCSLSMSWRSILLYSLNKRTPESSSNTNSQPIAQFSLHLIVVINHIRIPLKYEASRRRLAEGGFIRVHHTQNVQEAIITSVLADSTEKQNGHVL